ncbi:MAG: hypothetical protein IT580_17830 [Verrucomicrobiales bacterium]|nr:hypothetical protein [Verrucomicrobiales bacterium]
MLPARGRPRFLAASVAVVIAGLLASDSQPALAGPRLHEIQVIGSHNSYHIAPHPAVLALVRSRDPAAAASLAYTHRPLTDQLSRLGLRQIELDLYADPEGGRYASPAGRRLVMSASTPEGAAPPVAPGEWMQQPGAKILHVPDFDYLSHTPTLHQALREIRAWSVAHPAHVPLFVLLELKGEAAGPEFTQPIPWTAERIAALEAEILSVIPATNVLRPDDVRGTQPTLRDAVRNRGWPLLAETRGRVVFLLDNTDAARDALLEGNDHLAGRVLFASVSPTHPAAAWFKLNDPVGDFAQIQELVRQGFLVRTRADADLRPDPARREAALASGAQLISTDFPEPDLSLGSYQVVWPQRAIARPNPVSAPALDVSLDPESLALPGLEPFARRELVLLRDRAVAAHQLRQIGAASLDYARLLALEPVRPPSDAELSIITGLAPRLITHSAEPFALRDVVAIHHPEAACVGYHLFWEDDIDFPEDNDPADHEVIWVTYDRATGHAERVFTYFHSQLLEAPAGAARPAVAVEWGKHGSLPLNSDGSAQDPPGLRTNWQRLTSQGTRLPNHPLAAGWPRRFDGNWTDYRTYSRAVESEPLLRQRRLVWVSRWANATLDQHALAYNFAAKTEWPPAVLASVP